MLRITRSEESKLTSWYFEIDRGLLGCILILIVIGLLAVVSVGSAEAAHRGDPWFFFLKKALLPYSMGFVALFGFSMLNKKQVIRISIVGLVLGIIALLFTFINKHPKNGSLRWFYIGGFSFMPSDFLKPFFVVLTAWFLSKMHKVYGSDIFMNKDAFKFKLISWWPYAILFAICIALIFMHPDVGTALLYTGVLAIMLFVAGFPYKFLPVIFSVFGVMAVAALTFMPHIKKRAAHIFDIARDSQAWYSINSIRHGGLFGSGEEAYVKEVLPESTNDFVYSAIAEDWGAISACALVVLLFVILSKLIKHASMAKDDFVVYAVAGAAALFGGQICFNLMTALHLVIDKGMTLPFVSYGGVSFVVFCILFGITLALIREDTWNN